MRESKIILTLENYHDPRSNIDGSTEIGTDCRSVHQEERSGLLQPVSSSVTITTLELFMPLVFIENNVEVEGD